MKKLLLLSLLLSAFAFAPKCVYSQATTGYHRVEQVIARSNSGVAAQVVPGATIFVTNTATGVAATIYYDPLLSSLITNSTVVTDVNGDYSYYIANNYCVTENISSPGQGSYTIPNVCVNSSGGSITSSAQFEIPFFSASGTSNMLTGSPTLLTDVSGNFYDTLLANTNTGFSLAGPFPGSGGQPGSGYSSCAYTLSGGTYTSAPVLGCIATSGGVRPIILNPGVGTVPPTVTVTGTGGTGATLILAVQPNSVTATSAGLFQTQPIQGVNSQATTQSTTLVNAAILGSVLGPDNGTSGMDQLRANYASGVLGLLQANAGTQLETVLDSFGNGTYNAIGFRSTQGQFASADAVRIGPLNQNGTTDNDIFQIDFFNQSVPNEGNISFMPCSSGTVCLPETKGINFFLTMQGPLALGNAGSTSGYTGTGTCTVTGGVLVSGTADTCTAPTSGGFVAPTLTNTGNYSVPPVLNFSGFATGANYSVTAIIVPSSTPTLTGSFSLDPSGTYHFSNSAVGVTGNDFINFSNVGAATFNGHVTASGGITDGNITGSTQCVQAGSSGVLSGSGGPCGGTGNTTSTALTTNFLPKANGANSIINSLLSDNATTLLYAGAGGISSQSQTLTGTFSGNTSWLTGTGSIPALSAGSAGFAGPASGGTPWLCKLPATITAGLFHFAAPATNEGVNESACTSSLVAIADLSATGSPSGSTFLRGDNTWAAVSGAGANTQFSNVPVGSATTAEGTAVTTNQIKVAYVYIPQPGLAGVTDIGYSVSTPDNSANLYDLGFYGPGCIGGATTIPLAGHIGATAGSTMAPSSGRFHVALAATSTAAAGDYCFAWTSSGTTPLLVLGGTTGTNYVPFAVSTPVTQTSTSGILPSSITAPTTTLTGTSPLVLMQLTNF